MYLPDCILDPRSCQALPPVGRLWPSCINGLSTFHAHVIALLGSQRKMGIFFAVVRENERLYSLIKNLHFLFSSTLGLISDHCVHCILIEYVAMSIHYAAILTYFVNLEFDSDLLPPPQIWCNSTFHRKYLGLKLGCIYLSEIQSKYFHISNSVLTRNSSTEENCFMLISM